MLSQPVQSQMPTVLMTTQPKSNTASWQADMSQGKDMFCVTKVYLLDAVLSSHQTLQHPTQTCAAAHESTHQNNNCYAYGLP